MIIPGRITLRAKALALACFVCVAPVFGSKILIASSQSRSVNQDVPQVGSTKSPHQYTPLSVTFACGVIPYEGYDGRVNSETTKWKCVDGASVYLVKEGFASSRSSEAERLARLKEKAPAHKPWRIVQTESVGNTTVVELAKQEPFDIEDASSSKWIIMWVRDASLFMICGPDREHVMDYYQTRYEGDAKK